jgi:hypothetical protein
MSELVGISESKARKEAAMQEIKDRETTKEVKGHAMAELKKVADIREKVVNVELPTGAAEKVKPYSFFFIFSLSQRRCQRHSNRLLQSDLDTARRSGY